MPLNVDGEQKFLTHDCDRFEGDKYTNPTVK